MEAGEKIGQSWIACLLLLPALPLIAGVALRIPSLLLWGKGDWVLLLAGGASSCLLIGIFLFLRTLSRFHMIRHALKLEKKACGCGSRDRSYRMWALGRERMMYCGETLCRKCGKRVSLLETDFRKSRVME